MPWIDITILTTLIISTALSIYRGLIVELFSFSSVFLAYIAANNFYLKLTDSVNRIVSFQFPSWISYVFIYVFTVLFVVIIGKLLRKVVHISISLKLVDRVGGGILGSLKGLLIISVLLLPISFFNFSQPMFKKSILIPYLFKGMTVINFFSSSDLIREYEKKYWELKKGISKNITSHKKSILIKALNQQLPKGSNTPLLKTLKNLNLTDKKFENISENDKQKLEEIIRKNINQALKNK